MTSHIGCKFKDAEGVQRLSLQLLNDKGSAVAILDLGDGAVERFMYADSVKVEAEQWKQHVLSNPLPT